MKARLSCILFASVIFGSTSTGCSSAPPAPASPDEATRRPVNTQADIALQSCQARLANAQLALAETARGAAAQPFARSAAAASPGERAAQANTVYVVYFEFGRHEIELAGEDLGRLVADAKSAAGILVRGRTDAVRDSGFDRALAAARAQAVFNLLVAHGVDPARIRLTSQGQGDLIYGGGDEKIRALNRRAEIEIYRIAPELVSFVRSRAP